MFLSKPPVRPDLSFFKECIETLIKYDDRFVTPPMGVVNTVCVCIILFTYLLALSLSSIRIGVKMLWNSVPELGLEPDEEITELVSFL